jgi:hypothetical protein
MTHDYVEINGKDYRIEFNWNSMTDFFDRVGKKPSDLDKMDELTAAQYTTLFHAGVVEGCRMDGVEFPFSEKDFGAALTINNVAELLMLYRKHSTVKSSVTVKVKKK